jgi:hypothetical protein
MQRLPKDVKEFFRKQGSIGGKKSRAMQTPAERKAQAKKAVAARWAKQKPGK